MATATLGRPAEVTGNEFSFDGTSADEQGVVLVPVGAEDRLDYKIEHDDGMLTEKGLN